MRTTQVATIVALCGAVTLWGCSDETASGSNLGPGSGGDAGAGGGGGGGNVAACAVFFTELLPDPQSDDAEDEYVELHNPGGSPVNIGGCTLELERGPEGDVKSHEILGQPEVPAAGYLRLGPENADDVDYNWRSIGNLPNSSTKGLHTLRLMCGGVVVTSVSYLAADGEVGLGKPTSGIAFQLDGSNLTCEAAADYANWCAAPDDGGAGNRASRGTANPACPGPPMGCTVAACDVFFTEYLADPGESADAAAEFVELHNPGGSDVDLRGCALTITKGDGAPDSHIVDAASAVTVPAGGYLVLGPEGAVEVAGYNWSDIGNLPNSSSAGAVKFALVDPANGTEIDSFTYLTDTAPLDAPDRGVSAQVCRDQGFSCAGNDDVANWSLSETARPVRGERATPGAANRPCVEITCIPTACDGTQGAERLAEQPAPGDLVITEVFPNPAEQPETDWEWFEVRNVTDGPVDLNGVGLVQKDTDLEPDHVFGGDLSCVTIEAGEHAVFVRAPERAEAAGLSVCAGFTYESASLVNNDGYLALWSRDGTILDEVRWDRSEQGRSIELDPDCEQSAAANDDSDCWCDSQRPQYTPPQDMLPRYHSGGDANEGCAACFCQQADGAWRSVDQPFSAGGLEITEVMSNVPGNESDNPDWEFIEVRATAAGALNCGAVVLGDSEVPFPWTRCVELDADSYALLARAAEGNGALPAAQVQVVPEMPRLNAEGRVAITIQGNEIAAIDYQDGGDGVAWQQDPGSGAWCAATVLYSQDPEARGTPGQAGTACE